MNTDSMDEEEDSSIPQRLVPIISAIRNPPTTAEAHSELRRTLAKDIDLFSRPSKAQVKESLLERFLKPSNTFPESWVNDYGKHFETDPWARWKDKSERSRMQDLFYAPPAELTTGLEFVTSGLDGKIVGCREVTKSKNSTLTAKTSTSLARAPANYADTYVRGKSGYFPFAPGGLDSFTLEEEEMNTKGTEVPEGGEETAAQLEATRLEKGLELARGGIRTIPPGFTRGLDFSDAANLADDLDENAESDEDEGIKVTPVYRPVLGEGINRRRRNEVMEGDAIDKEVDELLPASKFDISRGLSSTSKRKGPAISKRDWAHVVDVNRELENFKDLVPDMAHQYPFELDTFQKEAVYHLEMGDSVFVAAHTSAGKTVVAEYAIALAQKHMTRCIYTSPIKALSNQKFRDFKTTFGSDSVGILTGDVQINPEAPCLIMTTEILRSMLYKGADLIRDVEFVVFDEVHYVNDAERGVVWEEVIIMLPEHVTIILLSATVPNTKEFADWVGRTKRKDIYVISTPKRPVPLEHFLYAGRELFKLLDAKGEFLGQGWRDANEALKRRQDKEREAAGLGPVVKQGASASRGNQRGGARGAAPTRGRGNSSAPMRGRGGGGGTFNRGAQHDRNLWIHLIGVLKKKELLPVVVFTFSKRRCEENAASMPNTDLCTSAEKSEVHVVIERSINRLRGSDKNLPQIQHMRDLLGRGIGVHHGGLLPIVKEMVEILFARGLVKVLFATETFAMGVNMPARTVVFSGIRKHDGKSFRDLLAGEYTQMSGRAGRRGLDKTGVVIIVCDGEVPDTTTLHKMLLGSATKLQSQFRLTYNMILNLLRVEALRVEEMIKRSFSENAQQRLLPDQQKKVAEEEKKLTLLKALEESPKTELLRRFYDVSSRLVFINQRVTNSVLAHPAASKMLSNGRVVILKDGHFRDNPALILKNAPNFGGTSDERSFFVLAFVSPTIRAAKNDVALDSVPPRWPPFGCDDNAEDLTYELAKVPTTSIALVTKHCMKVDIDEIAERHKKSHMKNALRDFTSQLLPHFRNDLLEQEADFSKLRSLDFREALQSRNKLVDELASLEVELDKDFNENYVSLHTEQILTAKISELRLAISEQNLELLPDYEARIGVLQDLRFIDQRSTVLLKGRVACEINSANELILTEVILENVFSSYDPAEVVALLSAFIFQDKTEVEPELTPKLIEGLKTLTSISNQVEIVSVKRNLSVESDQGGGGGRGKETLRFGLVGVVYEWARGMPFDQLTALTDVQEGTIVRTITRLDETCREVRDAARVIGDGDLYRMMETCQTLIRRCVKNYVPSSPATG